MRCEGKRYSRRFQISREDIIQRGRSLDVDGVWRVEQLKEHLQNSIRTHQGFFNTVLQGIDPENSSTAVRGDEYNEEVEV